LVEQKHIAGRKLELRYRFLPESEENHQVISNKLKKEKKNGKKKMINL
jgi:hypothetical protein